MTNTESPSLLLLDLIPESYWRRDQVLSGLQSFETSLYLVAANRWPSVISLLWEACEKLLLANCEDYVRERKRGQPRARISAEELQEEYRKLGNISQTLHDSATKLRKKRNKIAHRGYMPKDDVECINLFFTAGVPYLQNLMEQLFQKPFSELSSFDWYWSIYSDTRKVVHRQLQRGTTDLYAALFFLRTTSRNIWRVGNANRAYSVYSETQAILHETLQDVSDDIRLVIRNRFIRLINALPYSYCVELPSYSCLICDGASIDHVLAGVSFKQDAKGHYQVGDVLAFACTYCGYAIRDPEVVKIFCSEKLSADDLNRIARDESLEAKIVNVGFDSPWEPDIEADLFWIGTSN